jgi:hypothetical protein
MSGSGLMDFLIEIIGLLIVGTMIFLAIDFISTDERFKKIGKLAVGGVLLLLFLIAVKGVLFGGGGTAISVAGLISFAIGVIVVLVVWFIITRVLGIFLGYMGLTGSGDIIQFVIGALVLIVILILAANMLLGGGSGNFFHFQLGRHGQLIDPSSR